MCIINNNMTNLSCTLSYFTEFRSGECHTVKMGFGPLGVNPFTHCSGYVGLRDHKDEKHNLIVI